MIYLKTNKELKTIREILLELYSYNIVSSIKAIQTYKDEHCKSLHCDEGKYRSFDDIIELIQTYIPEAKLEDIIHEMIILYIKQGKYIYPYYCNNIEMSTFHYYPYTVENIPEAKGFSKYSWEEIFEKVGINTVRELTEYTNKHKLEYV